MVRFAGLAEHLLGNHDSADRLALGQLEAVGADSPQAGQLQIELAYGGFMTADWPAVRRWANAALGSKVDRARRAAALSLQALGEYAEGDGPAANASAAAARDLVDGLEDAVLAGRLDGLAVLAWAEFCLEEVDHSLAHAARGIRISKENHLHHLIAAIQVVETHGLLANGAFGRAADVAEEAIDATRLSGNALFETWALTAAVTSSCRRATRRTRMSRSSWNLATAVRV